MEYKFLKARFPAKIDSLHAILDWLRKQLVLCGLDASSIRQTELASEEAIVNIIQHGYEKKEGSIEIELSNQLRQIEIAIRDRGPPFNLLEHEANSDPDAPLDDRQIGGLGILLIRKMMDEVRYCREGEENVLFLTKKKKSTDSSRSRSA